METLRARAGSAINLIPAAVAASCALLISTFFPLAGPLLIALVLGAVAANTAISKLAILQNHATSTKLLLRLGVVMLGLKLPIGDILDIGPGGIAVVLSTVFVTYFATLAIGDRLGLDRGFVTLLAAGFSICGAAAIAALDEAVRAKQKDVALAVAMVTAFGSLMIVTIPWLSALIGLSNDRAAVWAGASIHEVAQVVAAASIIGGSAIAIATTVKLGRVILLAPIYSLASQRADRDSAKRAPLVPWFVTGFAIAVAIRTTEVLDPGVLEISDKATVFLLSAGMFGLGMGIKAKEIWPVPINAFILATASTIIAAGTSLTMVLLFT